MVPSARHRLLLSVFLCLWLVADVVFIAKLAQWAQLSNPSFIPSHVRIPAIEVDAPIIPVGLTQEGRMDVPRLPGDVAWFSLGTKPGDKGSAVLAAHLDTAKGKPAVFWRLNELQRGEEIIVTDIHGNVLRFRVMRTLVYDEKDSPLQEIFGNADGIRLNLITCNGVWIHEERNYEKRLVIFTELADDGDVTASTQKIPEPFDGI